MELLLNDSTLSEETRQQARRSIQEINTAINVIDKAPVLKDAAQLGLIAADVLLLGEFAGARALTTTIVKDFIERRTGQAISDDVAAQVAMNFYRDADGFAQSAVREFKPGTTARAENINAGQVIDRDGLPRVGQMKDLSEEQLRQMLGGQSPAYFGTSYPAWREGTMVVDRVVTQPETYRMVVNERQYKAMTEALRTGDVNTAVTQLGGWATKDPILVMADVRNNLAITSEFKSGTLYSVEFTVKPGVGVREGTVGPMWDAPAGTMLPGGGGRCNSCKGGQRRIPISLKSIRTASEYFNE